MTWYNEIDSKKAAWLRELISHGLIAPGDVDERSIADVRPCELQGYAQCHFFAGIGIWSYALRLAGWPDDREVWTGSCPCQPFSAAGKGEAFDDERHLWPEFFRLIEARRPIVCFGEQVASIDGLAWLDLVQSDLDGAGYTCGAVDICAAGFGAPHRRQRLYWVADDESNGRGKERANHSGIGAGDGAQGRPSGFDAGRFPDGLGHTSGQGLEVGRCKPGHAGQECVPIERTGDVSRLENTLRTERRPDQRERDGHREASGRHESAGQPGERSEVERLDDAPGARYDWTVVGPEGDPRDASRLRVPSERGSAGSVGNPEGSERGLPIQRTGSREDSEPARPGPVNGFWGDANWVLTRPQRLGDRPGLRPVERKSQSMVDGLAADMGSGRDSGFPLAKGAEARVARLRGYGDGIVAPAAVAFIQAWMGSR